MGALLLSLAAGQAFAAQWSVETHTLAAGDFNGDGRSDLLVIARSASQPSGIALSNSSGVPTGLHQTWGSNHLGITWSGSTYAPRIGDFNGDGRDDVFLQRVSGGNHYLLLATANGKLTAIYQTLTNSSLSVAWSQAERRIEVGDFNDDGRADLFLQSKALNVDNAVVLGTTSGFTGVTHTWPNAHLALEWSGIRALGYAGEFNGDGNADFLVQAKPNWVAVPSGGITFALPYFRDESYATVAADSGGDADTALDTWDHNHLGLEWSAVQYDALVENFDGTCGDDILLQAKRPGGSSHLVLTTCGGTLPSGSTTVHTFTNGELGLAWDGASYSFQAGDFDGNGRADIYMQAAASGGTSRIAFTASGGDVTATPTVHDPSLTTTQLSYTYDELGRLETVTFEDGSVVEYEYDAAGNRTVVTTVLN
jgi:YD repeat-containing protein